MSLTEHDGASFGALLKTFRKRRRLTQHQLAEAIGIHRITIIRWEQGDVLPESKTMVLELARHLRLDQQESRQLLEASLTALAPSWSVPFARNPFFTGREEILEALHTHLSTSQAVALTQSYALHGLGGIGKTQIALEYAYLHALDYRAVFWIGAETAESIIASMLRIAEVLRLPGREDQEQRVTAAVQHWLSTHYQWLVICDNVDDPELLHDFLPPERPGALLITTRSPALGPLALGLDVLPLGAEEGQLLLLRRAGVLAPDALSEQVRQMATRQPAEEGATEELVTVLGGLPLALDQAGAYLQETGCSATDYLQRYQQHRPSLLSRRGTSAGHHPQSVATTFQLSTEQVRREQPAALDFLQVCALLQAEAIPEELFLQGARCLGPQLQSLGADPLSFDQIIAVLRRFSLIERQAEAHTLSLHRLVQAVLLDTMTELEQKQWSRRAIEALDVVFPEVLPNIAYATWKLCERLLPHALLILHRTVAVSEYLPLASLAYKMAYYLLRSGRYAEAAPLSQRALQIREQVLGPEHPDVAASLNNLAVLSINQGNFAEAALLLQRALQIREQVLGPEHPDVAAALNNLAVLSWEQGNFTEAAPLFQRTLQIRERALGPEHPDVAAALNNLAELHWEQGNFAEAATLSQRALQIRERALSPEHPDVAEPLYMLARLSWEQGNFAEAEALFQRALHLLEQALGSKHLRVVAPLNNLAELYLEQGNFAEAEALFQRTLQIREQVLGPEHPDVADSLNGLANLSRDQGRHTEAELLYQRTLSLRELHLGQHHPKIAQTQHDLAIFRQRQSNAGEALSFAERALSIRSQSLGDAHPKTVATRTLYNQLLQEQSDAKEEAAYQQSTEKKPDPPEEKRHAEEASLTLHETGHPSPPENDSLQEFLDACCELHPLARCRISELWHTYEQWTAISQRRIPLSRHTFAAQIKARGCRVDRTSTTRIWRGIRLVKTSL